jgi:hypothetical protein
MHHNRHNQHVVGIVFRGTEHQAHSALAQTDLTNFTPLEQAVLLRYLHIPRSLDQTTALLNATREEKEMALKNITAHLLNLPQL